MGKNLGTNLHVGGFSSNHTKNKQRWSLVSRIFTSFNFVPGRGGRTARNFWKGCTGLWGHPDPEITENYEYCVTVPRNFVLDCIWVGHLNESNLLGRDFRNILTYYVLFRPKSTPGSSRKDPVQEEMRHSVETSSEASSDDCVSSNKVVISSPVSHLWNSEDGVTPLVRPEDATSTGIMYAEPPLF